MDAIARRKDVGSSGRARKNFFRFFSPDDDPHSSGRRAQKPSTHSRAGPCSVAGPKWRRLKQPITVTSWSRNIFASPDAGTTTLSSVAQPGPTSARYDSAPACEAGDGEVDFATRGDRLDPWSGVEPPFQHVLGRVLGVAMFVAAAWSTLLSWRIIRRAYCLCIGSQSRTRYTGKSSSLRRSRAVGASDSFAGDGVEKLPRRAITELRPEFRSGETQISLSDPAF